MTSLPGNSAYSHQTQTSWTTIALQSAYTSTRWCAVAHTSAQTFAVGALAGSPVEADNPVEAGIPVEAAGTPREALDTFVDSDWASLASSLLGCCSLTWSRFLLLPRYLGRTLVTLA